MADDPDDRLQEARRHLAAVGYSDLQRYFAAYEGVLAAERAVYKARGEQYADVLDLGIRWSTGAPDPHVLANGHRAFVVFFVEPADPEWDGTYTRVLDASTETSWGVVELWGYASLRVGAPNDEAIQGHPLYGRGLSAYAAHEVLNSAWIEEHRRMNSVHPHHSDATWSALRHFLLAFHDDMVEVIARGIEARPAKGNLTSILTELSLELVRQPARRN